MTKTPLKSATEFRLLYGLTDDFATLDQDSRVPGIQLKSGNVETCIEDFQSLSPSERRHIIRILDWDVDKAFLLAVNRFSVLEKTPQDMLDKVRTILEALEDEAHKTKTVTEQEDFALALKEAHFFLQTHVLEQLLSRMTEGLFVSRHDYDTYDDIRTRLKSLYTKANYAFDSDDDGVLDVDDAFPLNSDFSVDRDSDGVADTIDAALNNKDIFFDQTSLAPPSFENPYDVMVEKDGSVTLSIVILVKKHDAIPYEGDLEKLVRQWQDGDVEHDVPPLNALYEKLIPLPLKGRVHIRVQLMTDPTFPHHTTVVVPDTKISDQNNDVSNMKSWRADASAIVIAHEIGHIFGWLDRYHVFPSSIHGLGGDRTFFPGYFTLRTENDLMVSESLLSTIQETDLRQAIASATPKGFALYRLSMLNYDLSKSLQDIHLSSPDEMMVRLYQAQELIKRGIQDYITLQSKLSPAEQQIYEKHVQRAGIRMARKIQRTARIFAFRSPQRAGEIIREGMSLFRQLEGLPTSLLERELAQFEKLDDTLEAAFSQMSWPENGYEYMHALPDITLSPEGLDAIRYEFQRQWDEQHDGEKVSIFDVRSAQSVSTEEDGQRSLPHLIFRMHAQLSDSSSSSFSFSLTMPPPRVDQTPQEYAAMLYQESRELFQRAQKYDEERFRMSIQAGLGMEFVPGGNSRVGLMATLHGGYTYFYGIEFGGDLSLFSSDQGMTLDLLPNINMVLYNNLSLHLGIGGGIQTNRIDIGLAVKLGISCQLTDKLEVGASTVFHYWNNGEKIPNPRYDDPAFLQQHANFMTNIFVATRLW